VNSSHGHAKHLGRIAAKMVASNIKVFFRVRPSAKPSKAFNLKQDEGLMEFSTEKHSPEGQVNNTKTHYKFKFDGILPMKVTQEEVFDTVAKPVIEDVLSGINGTIFAYGQTGSGKTFTITGGAERYQDRGLIPRTIAYLFEEFKNRKDATYRMYISYLEIYNNDGYDLLSREDNATKLEDLPKVQLREDEDGNIHLRNLSVNMAQKAEDALNLLFLGDTNRVVAETPMNDASTRSHCMFILWIDSTKADSDTVRRAKLHLVDLAGSERISKTGVEGNLQKEARYINLSLHYLEQVIVALHERSQGARAHVPYRNSMMTSVLRDSLGGNCKTVMVGTAAVEDRNIDESISTCRFAQRVAAIKNNAIVNEELDPAMLIRRLKKEVAELKDELKLLNSEDGAEPITDADKEECQKLVQAYLAQQDPDGAFACGSMTKFRECFRVMRDIYWQQGVAELGSGGTSGGSSGSRQKPAATGQPSGGGALSSLEATVLELRQQVVQRDQEIGILVGSLSKKNSSAAKEAASDGRVFIRGTPREQGSAGTGGKVAGSPAEAVPESSSAAGQDSAALLLDRNQAFEVFRKSVRRSETLEEGRDVMRKLVTEAKSLGEKANAARSSINSAKTYIEKVRMERAMALGSSPRDPDAEDAALPPDTPEVMSMLQQIEEHKGTYKKCTERLKVVKEEIDRLKASDKQNKERLQKDFEAWYHTLQASQAAGPGASAGAASLKSTLQLPPQEERTNRSRSPTSAFAPDARPSPAAAAAPPAKSGSPAAAAAAAAGKPAPAAVTPTALTGHQQTDDDIAAYFAAIANLQSG